MYVRPNHRTIFPLKPTSTYVKAYYAAMMQLHEHGHTTEGNTRSAFADLLKRCASPYDWHLVEEYQFKGTNKQIATMNIENAFFESVGEYRTFEGICLAGTLDTTGQSSLFRQRERNVSSARWMHPSE